MKRLQWFGLAVLLGAASLVWAQAPIPAPANPKPAVQDLGDGKFRVGNITVDKTGQSFSLPGVVLRREPPLEFFAVTKGGSKGYETLVELETDAFAFNLACLLIGLDPEHSVIPTHHYENKPLDGDRISLTIQWQDAQGKPQEAPAASWIALEGAPQGGSQASNEWVYIGSQMLEHGYLAELTGILIGFSHTPAAVIDHVAGIGLGAYGSVAANLELVPPAGTPLTLVVRRIAPE